MMMSLKKAWTQPDLASITPNEIADYENCQLLVPVRNRALGFLVPLRHLLHFGVTTLR